MNTEATRQILWNLEHPANSVVMYMLFALSALVCGTGIFARAALWAGGKSDERESIPLFQRLKAFCRDVLLQSRVVRTPVGALAHTLVYLGFITLLFTTTMVFLDHDLGIDIYKGQFYLAVTILSDMLGLGLLIGVALFAHRRLGSVSDGLHTRPVDWFLLAGLALLCVQGFLLEGLRIHATQDPWGAYSPVGWLVAQLFWGFSQGASRALHFFIWWFHTVTVFVVIALLPYSKLFHVIASAVNLYFGPSARPRGALSNPGDLMQLMESSDEFSLGLGSIKDYSWRQRLELDACTSCGRCQDVCPAYRTGKPLSPKWVILDSRNHMLSLHAEEKLSPSPLPAKLAALDRALTRTFLENSGLSFESDGAHYVNGGVFRAQSEAVHTVTKILGADPDARIAGDVIDPMTFWSCTTCYACVEACPVGINHVDQIVGVRRNMALMHGEIPAEAQGTLRALENRGNPFGDPKDRTRWLDGLDVPILEAGATVDYLYWVGCVSAYDPRKQRIAQSLVKIMRAAGLSFGVLGSVEGCSGDPARRLGEENLFQTLAKKNIETLKSIRFKTLVANCPHCFNSIKNEYPQFGNLGAGREPDIIHHSVLLKQLLAQGKITLREESGSITFHDPCYLGRYNNEYDAPRQTLQAAKGLQIVEMEENRERGMCCGAGGGHFWMDLKRGERVNVKRTLQVAATGVDTVATACPFCMQMMEDGTKLTGKEDQIKVRDIAEVIAERLVEGASSH